MDVLDALDSWMDFTVLSAHRMHINRTHDISWSSAISPIQTLNAIVEMIHALPAESYLIKETGLHQRSDVTSDHLGPPILY